MPLAKIENKNNAEEMLKGAIVSGKVAHAYLFLGPDKKLMGDVAIKFVKALNCLESKNSFNSCGECISCKKIENFNHPDMWHIRVEGKARNVKIEQIRKLRKDIYLKPTEAKKKAYIIYDADLMMHEAANCLLKTLEEPPKDVVIILISSHFGAILPTIVSRCQAIKFSQNQSEAIEGEGAIFIKEFLDADNPFLSEGLEFISRPRDEQLKTIDMLLLHFRNMLVNVFLKHEHKYSSESILVLMNKLLKSKGLLISNVNVKMVADYILDNICCLKAKG